MVPDDINNDTNAGRLALVDHVTELVGIAALGNQLVGHNLVTRANPLVFVFVALSGTETLTLSTILSLGRAH